eukprot:12895404-Prorocentrum_lima.AAC.1
MWRRQHGGRSAGDAASLVLGAVGVLPVYVVDPPLGKNQLFHRFVLVRELLVVVPSPRLLSSLLAGGTIVAL